MLADTENEYKKFPQLEKAEVLKLMDWCKRQPHLPNLSELEIIIFLHSCYNNLETTKKCIDTSYTIRTNSPDLFGKRDVLGQDVQAQMNVVLLTPLPGLTPEGYKVIFGKFIDSDPSKFVLADALKLFFMVSDLNIMEEGTAKGYVLIFDQSGTQFGHLAKVGITTVKKSLLYLQEGMPVRLKGLHLFNTVSFLDKILALLRPFMKDELFETLKLHSTIDSLLNNVNKEQLPNEYGGNAGTFNELREKTYQHIERNRDFFLQEESGRRVNEKLRPRTTKIDDDLFGVAGNFKKLDLD